MPVYKVTLVLHEQSDSPLSATQAIADYIEQESRHVTYDVEDEDTGEKWWVDLDADEDAEAVSVNTSKE